MTDFEAYTAYPQSRHWYDKVWVATQLGYQVGTERIPRPGHYVVRPTMNLQGCGIGASIKFYMRNAAIPLDCFWSQVFHGPHVTIDYTRADGVWQQGHTFQGFNTAQDLVHFDRWTRITHAFVLPECFDQIESDHINIEIIGNRIIEVHLRHNTDPVQYDQFVPIWHVDQICPPGHVRVNDTESHVDRLGFFCKK